MASELRRKSGGDSNPAMTAHREYLMAGYSGTPLANKLGIKPGFRIYGEQAPDHYRALLEPLPDSVSLLGRLTGLTNCSLERHSLSFLTRSLSCQIAQAGSSTEYRPPDDSSRSGPPIICST